MDILTKIIGILGVCLLSFSPATNACNCIGPDNFFGSLDSIFFNSIQSGNPENYAVVKGVITGLTSNQKGIRLIALHKYLGHQVGDTISVWNTTGIDCRANINSLYNGASDTLIFILNRITSLIQSIPYEDTVDYYLSQCGSRFLIVKNDSIYGGFPGTFAYDGYPLKDFTDSLFSFEQRVKTLNAEEIAEKWKHPIATFPNPANNVLYLSVADSFPNILDIRITDMTGRDFGSAYFGLPVPNRFPIDVRRLNSGYYCLQIITTKGSKTIGFVHQ